MSYHFCPSSPCPMCKQGGIMNYNLDSAIKNVEHAIENLRQTAKYVNGDDTPITCPFCYEHVEAGFIHIRVMTEDYCIPCALHLGLPAMRVVLPDGKTIASVDAPMPPVVPKYSPEARRFA